MKINQFNENTQEGLFLVNKPRGKSSFWVVRQFKKRYPELKVGHAGTLDPLAEGLLIILVGRATKRQKEFKNLDKEYEVEMIFGVTTDSFDLEGELKISSCFENLEKINREKIEQIVRKKYLGKIVQTVPLYSAVKHKGQRLYRLARKGNHKKIVLPKKEVDLIKFSIIEFFPLKEKRIKPVDYKKALKNFPKLKINLKVSKGFYVRSFVSDLGKEFRVGAVTTKLVRTKIGPHLLDEAIEIKEDIQASEDR